MSGPGCGHQVASNLVTPGPAESPTPALGCGRIVAPPHSPCRPGGVVGGDDPVRRHAVLQRHDISGAADIPYQLELRQLVWRPDAFGSICFLVSGVIAYHASARHRMPPERGRSGREEPSINLLACTFFGISDVVG